MQILTNGSSLLVLLLLFVTVNDLLVREFYSRPMLRVATPMGETAKWQLHNDHRQLMNTARRPATAASKQWSEQSKAGR